MNYLQTHPSLFFNYSAVSRLPWVWSTHVQKLYSYESKGESWNENDCFNVDHLHIHPNSLCLVASLNSGIDSIFNLESSDAFLSQIVIIGQKGKKKKTIMILKS